MPVDVVMPLYRGREWLPATLASLQAQTFTDWRLVAVDDACPERTGDLLTDHTVLRLPSNAGPAAARNHAVAHSTAPLVAFMDQDDLWHPDKLQRQVDALTANPHAGGCHTDVLLIDEHGNPLGEADTNDRRRRLDWDADRRTLVRAQFAANHVKNASMMFRRTAWDDVGGYRFTKGGDDWELWLRFLARGWRLIHLPEPLHYWRQHDRNTSARADRATQVRAVRKAAALRYAHLLGPRTTLRTLLR